MRGRGRPAHRQADRDRGRAAGGTRLAGNHAAVLHLALSTLPARQRRALAAAVPALAALARAVDWLADTTGLPAEPGS